MISNTFSGFGSMTVRNTNIVTMSSFIVMIQCMFHEKRSEENRNTIIYVIMKKLQALDSEYIIVKKSLRKENQGQDIPTLQTPSGIPAATNISKANTLVNQFTSVFTKEITETTNLTSTQCTQTCPKYHSG